MSVFFRLLRFLLPFWKMALVSIFFGVLTIASGVGLMGTSAYLISFAALQPSIAVLQVAIVGVRFLGISRGVFRYLERLASHDANFRLLANLRVWFYEKIEPHAPARLIGLRSGDLLSRAVGDIEILENFYVRIVSPLVVGCVVTVGVTLFFAWMHLEAAALLGAGLVIAGTAAPIIGYLAARQPGKQQVLLRGGLQAEIVEDVQGIEDLLAFNQVDARKKRVNDYDRNLGKNQFRSAIAAGMANAFVTLMTGLTAWAILYALVPYAGLSETNGIRTAVLIMMALASFEVIPPIVAATQNLGGNLESGKRLLEWEQENPSEQRQERHQISYAGRDIHFENLTFGYSPGEPPVIRGLTFNMQQGMKIALVGASGAGKTTLFNLLQKFWDSPRGTVVIDGIDLCEIPPENARQLFVVVSQSTYLFNHTLRENLRIGKATATDAEMQRALDLVNLSAWAAQLPEGLDTWLGEHGRKMSGGERQRLAIARALLREAPVWLLDEPTAHLDPETEKEIIDNLFQLTSGKTVLWATHHLEHLDRMDKILVLKGGAKVEFGTHAELLKSGGWYARMWSLQHGTFINTPGTFA